MNKDLNSVLTTLGNKLDVGTDVLFTALIKQAGIMGTIHTIVAIIGMFLFFLCIVGYFQMKKELKEEEEKTGKDDTGSLILMAVFSIFVLLFDCMFIYNSVTAFYNPEYWALKEVLSSLGGR